MFVTTEKEKISELKYGGYNQEILKIVPGNSKVLDIGCSTGVLAKLLKNEKKCSIVGVDFDQKSLSIAKKNCLNVYCIDLDNAKDMRKYIRNTQFDVITIGDVLEHLKHPGVLLRELRRYLKPNGVLITSLPNSAFISMRAKFLFGDFNYNKNGGLMDADHLRFFSFDTAKLLFNESGYKITQIRGINIVRKRFWFLKPLSIIFPTLFSIQMLITAKKNN